MYICEVHGDTFDNHWLNGVDDQGFESSLSYTSSSHPIQSATDTQNAIMAYFSQNTAYTVLYIGKCAAQSMKMYNSWYARKCVQLTWKYGVFC